MGILKDCFVMELLIIKQGKWKYVFYSDEVVVMKKNKVLRTVRHNEIEKITYNPEYGLKDSLKNILNIFLWVTDLPYSRNAFVMYLEPDGRNISIKISNDDFERVKNTFKIPIELI